MGIDSFLSAQANGFQTEFQLIKKQGASQEKTPEIIIEGINRILRLPPNRLFKV